MSKKDNSQFRTNVHGLRYEGLLPKPKLNAVMADMALPKPPIIHEQKVSKEISQEEDILTSLADFASKHGLTVAINPDSDGIVRTVTLTGFNIAPKT